MDYTSKNDRDLGALVKEHLIKLNLESPVREYYKFENYEEKLKKLTEVYTEAVKILGIDLNNDSTNETPKRIAKMYLKEVMYGLDYDNFPRIMKFENAFQNSAMVVEKNIKVNSLCSHHFVPTIGYATVAYIPKDKVLGLSKLNRVVDFFSRRPQEQERLVMQIQAALSYVLETEDVAVFIEADHYCVKWRGVHDHSSMITSKLGGSFFNNETVRKEFYDIVNKK